ncbi:MAG: hypothetical protein FWH00_00240 [Oscillospiraceae bacterium]|nr:hypothetical protein [Oscillospiraceae bacterium]
MTKLTRAALPAMTFILMTALCFGMAAASTGSPSNSVNNTISVRPDIIIESARVFDAAGRELHEIDENTPPFTLEITYVDFGLIEAVNSGRDAYTYLESRRLEGFITNSPESGFTVLSNRGSLNRAGMSTRNDAPRFLLRFQDVTYNGKGTGRLDFRVHYGIEGEPTPVIGQGSAAFPQTNLEDDDDDEEDIPRFRPHIIISSFSFGNEQIIAGSEFSLDITYQNTSSDITLENILIRVDLSAADISIASGSTTIYVDSLPAGASQTHSFALQALPGAKMGSHGVGVEFRYQFRVVRNNRTEIENMDDSVTIAIPLTQIDRFVVDPISEMSEYVQTGDLFFVTVEFVNEGASPLRNISARIRGLNMEITSPISRFEGELRESASGSLDIEATSLESGNLMGEVVISYEDVQMNQREIVMPFSMFIQEPWTPDPNPGWPGGPGGPGFDEPPAGVTAQTVIFSIIGGVLMAAALAMYTARRIITKEREDLDEDF